MAGNSQRRGAMRKEGTKKGADGWLGRAEAAGSRGPQADAQGDRSSASSGRTPGACGDEACRGRPSAPAAAAARAPVAEPVDSCSGRNPVVEALRAGIPASALYVQTKVDADDRWRESMRLAVAAGIPIMEVAKSELDRMSDGAVHQGLVLTVPEYRLPARRRTSSPASLIVALDGLTDPRNLGAIARSAAAFGADGIVVPTRRSVGVTAAAWKTSAGALARVPVAQVTNLTRALETFQKRGFTVIGLAADSDVTLSELAEDVLTGPLVIVIGGEGSGLGRLVGETCDWRVSIPMVADVESLNASVAASIVLQAVFAARS